MSEQREWAQLNPFIKYFGGKTRAAKLYPPPKYDTIVEPFAGAAGYSLRYPDRNVVLCDLYEPLAKMWDYLIHVPEAEFMALPVLRTGQTVDDLDVPYGAKILIGFMVNTGAAAPCKTPSSWMTLKSKNAAPRLFQDEDVYFDTSGYWGPSSRKRLCGQLRYIRHWKIHNCSYADLEDLEATWFIDPPYIELGRHYKHGSGDIDYKHLGRWCKSRRGQVIVCENEGAEWLPFRTFKTLQACNGKHRTGISREVIWTKNCDPEPSIFNETQEEL